MRRFSNVVFMLAIILSTLCSFTVVQAADTWKHDWTQEYKIQDCMNVGGNAESAGICMGTLYEIRLTNGNKPIGFGGFSMTINTDKNLQVGIMPITMFDDMIWLGVMIDTQDFSFTSAHEDIVPTVGISLTDALNRLWD